MFGRTPWVKKKNYLIINIPSSWDIESIHPEQRDEGFIVDKLYAKRIT